MDQVPPIERPSPPGGLRVLHPLRIRDFALLFGGTTVSLFGDGIYLVAIAWQVYDLSNVPTALSIAGVACLGFLAVPGIRDPERWDAEAVPAQAA